MIACMRELVWREKYIVRLHPAHTGGSRALAFAACRADLIDTPNQL
jgi:hypothetical protein